MAANARTALAACLLESLLLIVVLRWDGLSRRQERQAKFITLSLVIAFGLALAMLLLSVGLLSRFYSIVDDSSLARVQVYEIFDYVSWTDILFGMDASVLLQVVREKIGIQHIESAPVYFTLLMGLPMAILFTLIVLSYMRRLIGGAATSAKIGSILIILVDLTNNAFATKSVDVLLVSVLLVGLGKVVDTSVTSRRQVMAKAGRSPQVVLRD
ncbi:hypothetical protein P6U16_22990 (plasmid) [Rhizobium sp. 32-5/1]|uniref:hypothetical protein n=1 Tax=Rhizobium sp. 32-5/1 TaxID=3019602 RepID=UPI00240DBE84|nr:hypothetical protein [Rhizobium sp. 32-5/1]WEZ85864.1 hypothetical protein P6U16_22990 [Rhizobium sp. 32-5/1]